RASEGDFHLAGGEAKLFCPRRPRDERIAIFGEAMASGLERRVRNDVILRLPTEKFPAWLAGGFAADIPERHVDRTERTDKRATAAVHRAASIKFLPNPFRLEG